MNDRKDCHSRLQNARKKRQLAVARQLVDVGRSLCDFDYKDAQHLSRTVRETMLEAERAFADNDYDQAEHLAKIVAYLVRREAPKFAANPQRWIETRAFGNEKLWRELLETNK
jgi:hypothetical protein